MSSGTSKVGPDVQNVHRIMKDGQRFTMLKKSSDGMFIFFHTNSLDFLLLFYSR